MSSAELSKPDFVHTRRDYAWGALDEKDLLSDPIAQFGKWFADAEGAGIAQPNATTLATVDGSGWPSARIVLLKEFDARGFAFYTNYNSQKARELDANPRAALLLFWDPLERQVRIEGAAHKVTRAESERYFHHRPRAAQIGAWASNQSSPLASRAELEQREREISARYEGTEIPLPDFWGGYRVAPEKIEFWQGRQSRLHDRLVYLRQADGSWKIQRLCP